jgi:hypothetical protein
MFWTRCTRHMKGAALGQRSVALEEGDRGDMTRTGNSGLPIRKPVSEP